MPTTLLARYKPLHDLPPLAGITTFADAARPGFSVDECVARLKRHHWAFRRLREIFIARLAAEPVYELKMAFSLHAHYCAEHASAWRERVAEMREPPLGVDVAPDPAFDIFFDEIAGAPTTHELMVGIYEHALPALRDALTAHMECTNRLVDHPSFRLCRFALVEVDEMLDYGRRAAAALVTDEARAKLAPWPALLDEVLRHAGGFDGAKIRPKGVPPRLYSLQLAPYDSTPRRDDRFADPYNMGVHAEAFLYDETMPTPPKVLMLYYKRLREIDVPEMMASIIVETPGKPWRYYRDMSRQLWDEARHAMMGEVGFVQAGIDWRKFVPVNMTFSLELNRQLTALERHAVLYFIEQGLMPKTGKRFEWETAVAAGDAFAAMIQDYDWADEVLHTRIGRDWLVKQVGNANQAVAFGDECWSRTLIDWEGYVQQGHTQHKNWWPALYREWCRVQGTKPDEAVLAFATTYAQVRADLKQVSSSA